MVAESNRLIDGLYQYNLVVSVFVLLVVIVMFSFLNISQVIGRDGCRVYFASQERGRLFQK